MTTSRAGITRDLFGVLVAWTVAFAILFAGSVDAQQGVVITNAQDGVWSCSSTWGGEVPGPDDTVTITAGTAVTMDVDATVYDMNLHGKLEISNGNELAIRTMKVMAGGELEMMEVADILIRDLPFTDAAQTETGMMVMGGSVNIVGSKKTTWTRATHAIEFDDTDVWLENADGWEVGDEIIIGNTSFKPNNNTGLPRSERYGRSHVALITAVTGLQVTFDPPMTHDAPAMADNPWGLEAYTAVANLTKPCTIKSENPDGTRGHIMVMDGSTFVASNFGIYDMGRTRGDIMLTEDTGTNRIGRYPFHVHRAPNAVVSCDNCVIDRWNKWGASFHESQDDTFQNSCVSRGIGSGIVAERGNEEGNVFSNNLTISIKGGYQFGDSRAGITIIPGTLRALIDIDGRADFAADGSGIWCRGSGNSIIGCLAIDCGGYGINLNGYYRDRYMGVPPAPGIIQNNEAAGCLGGFWATWSQNLNVNTLNDDEPMLVDGFVAWNMQVDAVQAFHDAHVTFDDVTLVNSPQDINSNQGSGGNTYGHRTLFFSTGQNYETINFVFNRARCWGANVGFEVANWSTKAGTSWLTVNDSEIHAYYGFMGKDARRLENKTFDAADFHLDSQWAAQQEKEPSPTLEVLRQ